LPIISPFGGLRGRPNTKQQTIKMNILQNFKPIKLIAMDVDGVLTDGSLILLDGGLNETRTMNIKDGYALQLAVKKGYHLMIISGASDTGAVENRMKKLGIKDVNMGIKDKAQLLIKKMNELGLSKEEVLFIGDDIPDYKVMKSVGLACCPSDAVTEIKDISMYISPFAGGKGCVRDIIEKVLKLNQHWDIENDIAAK
jgi:3-deoxy-D-manno-octulosonate 8-phosphate phosphatase (KDO 8-P phosphatase)